MPWHRSLEDRSTSRAAKNHVRPTVKPRRLAGMAAHEHLFGVMFRRCYGVARIATRPTLALRHETRPDPGDPMQPDTGGVTRMTSSALTAMQGGGFYNRNSSLQEAAIIQILPLWRALVAAAPVKEDVCVIVDYAASQGKNSLRPISLAIDVLRDRPESPTSIQVIHTDLPANDFSSLFVTLIEDPDSYLRKGSNIYPSAVGRSYFEPILPPESVHLAWNTWSLQWTSERPAEIRDHIFIDGSADAAARCAFENRLAQDWTAFLRARAMELAPDGRLLTMFVARDPSGAGWTPFWDLLWRVLQDMASEGLFTSEILTAISLPVGARVLDDVKAPFDASGRFAGLCVERLEMIEGPDPFFEDFRRTGDAGTFGEKWANMARAVIAPIISGVFARSGTNPDLMDEAFRRFAAAMAANPFRIEHHLALVILRKDAV